MFHIVLTWASAANTLSEISFMDKGIREKKRNLEKSDVIDLDEISVIRKSGSQDATKDTTPHHVIW